MASRLFVHFSTVYFGAKPKVKRLRSWTFHAFKISFWNENYISTYLQEELGAFIG